MLDVLLPPFVTKLLAGAVSRVKDAVGVDHEHIPGLQMHALLDEGVRMDGTQQRAAGGKCFRRSVRTQEQRGGMSGITVDEHPRAEIKARLEQACERHRRHLLKVTVHTCDDRLRLRIGGAVHRDQTCQVRDPHRRGDAFAADVAQGERHISRGLLCDDEIAGQLANRKDLADDVEVAASHLPRGTEPPMHLRRLKKHGM